MDSMETHGNSFTTQYQQRSILLKTGWVLGGVKYKFIVIYKTKSKHIIKIWKILLIPLISSGLLIFKVLMS